MGVPAQLILNSAAPVVGEEFHGNHGHDMNCVNRVSPERSRFPVKREKSGGPP